jgi:hypothetical protein
MKQTILYKSCDDNQNFRDNKRATVHFLEDLAGCSQGYFIRDDRNGCQREVISLYKKGSNICQAQISNVVSGSMQYLSVVLNEGSLDEEILKGKRNDKDDRRGRDNLGLLGNLEMVGFSYEKPTQGEYLKRMIEFDELKLPK